jgi:plasmid stabilization system protein ParE
VIGYRLLPLAEEEMTEAALFYEVANPGLGDDFLNDVQHAIDAVRERPEIGSNVGYGFRRVLIRRFPFSIIYANERHQILVVAIAHQRRGPGYWKERI